MNNRAFAFVLFIFLYSKFQTLFFVNQLKYFSLFLLVSTALLAQKNQDPFARSARLPDMSFGMGYNHNSQVKYKVPGGSLNANITYYNFDRRFLIGVEYTMNLKQNKATTLEETDPTVIAAESIFSQLVYNHVVYNLRAGWMLNEQLFLVTGFGVEILDQFSELNAGQTSSFPDTFFQSNNKKSNLFYLKYGIQYKRRYVIYDLFYSKRGIGVGINYFFNG